MINEKKPFSIGSDLNPGAGPEDAAEINRAILQAVQSLGFGSVEIIIHDSKVVQIERREKIRFDGASRERRR